MKSVLDKIGPIIVSFNVEALYNYKSGIIDKKNCSKVVNHNALAVGYGYDYITGLEYYIVKNSWGKDWGENGYFRIAMNKNMCGIGASALYLCPKNKCKKKNGKGWLNPRENCQCDGLGYIGVNVCADSRNCYAKTKSFSQCTKSRNCPVGWACESNLKLIYLIHLSIKYFLLSFF